MNLIKSVLVLSCISFTSVSFANVVDEPATDSTGLPGDHFSLQGALDLFKKAKNLEDFEKQLNEESNNVNNLDLNGDGDIDYIRVTDKMEGANHAIILQTPVNDKEVQDVAVIEIEKNGEKSAVLQIVGDDELYGDNTYVEPSDEMDAKPSKGPAAMNELITKRVIINVWFWPCVPVIYAPVYTPWVSPWYWHHYPGWWSPWRPYPWHYHYVHCAPYRTNYHVVYTHRVVNAHRVYEPNRRTSAIVATRYKPARDNYRTQQANNPGNRGGARDVKGNNGTRPNRDANRAAQPSRDNKVNRGTEQNRGNNREARPANKQPRQNREARPSQPRQQREGGGARQSGGNRGGGKARSGGGRR